MNAVSSLLCLALLIWSPPAAGQSLQTRNVFLVVIDGIRNQDGVEQESRTMPFLWDSLRPSGTLYTNFQNRGITVTNSGHSTLVTGVRQMLPNNSGIATPVRPQEPTIAEYYRKELGIPASGTYFISGKNSIWRYPVSLYPGYGYPWAPTITLTSSQDTLTWDSTQVIMDRDHPSLVYVLFAQVDAQGHTADSAKYFGAIRRVDSLIFLLWRKIQQDSLYRDRTTMIVTSDHGRHDDLHGGWQGHGDYCHGCRHIPFFAVGPDIRAGEAVTVVRDQVDVAPTVAFLLGFHAPLAQGSVMTEMFINAPFQAPSRGAPASGEQNLSGGIENCRSPSIAADRNGVHGTFSGGIPGARSVFWTRSVDGGGNWSVPAPLFSSPGTDYLETAIVPFGVDGLFAAATGSRYFAADSSFAWILESRRSVDAGLTWEPVHLLDTLTTISTKPALAASGGMVTLTAMMGYRVWNYISRDSGVTFTGKQIHAASSTTPACALLDTIPHVAWRHLNKDSLPCWNILYERKPWAPGDHPVTDNDTGSYSYHPSLVGEGDSVVHLVNSHLAGAPDGNVWQLHYRSKTGDGYVWEAAREIAPGRTAWSPVLGRSPHGDLYTVWADLDGGSWSIFSSVSPDRGHTWESPVRRALPQALLASPALAVHGDSVFVAWEDWRNGRPEIWGTSYSVFQTGSMWVSAGWNIVSLPADPPDRSVGEIFGCHPPFCNVFAYDSGSYRMVDTLQPGRAYWKKFSSGGVCSVRGRQLSGDTVVLAPGWNLVGGESDTVGVTAILSIPPGNIRWPAFVHGPSGYEITSLILPGRGHWIRADSAGFLVFPSAGEAGSDRAWLHLNR